MITCEKARDMISLYIDKLLDGNEKSELENHLKLCSECAQEYAEVKHIISLVADNCDEEDLPDDFGEKLHKRLLEECNSKVINNRFRLLNKKYIGIISTIAAMLVMAIIFKDLFSANMAGSAKLTKSQSAAKYENNSDSKKESVSATDSIDTQSAGGTIPQKDENAEKLDTSVGEVKPEIKAAESSRTPQPITEIKRTQADVNQQQPVNKYSSAAAENKSMDSVVALTSQPEAPKMKSAVPEQRESQEAEKSEAKVAAADSKVSNNAASFKASIAAPVDLSKDIKYTSIWIASGDQKAAMDKIRTFLSDNAAEYSQQRVQPAGAGIMSMKSTDSTVLDLKLSQKQYDAMVSYLLTYFGDSGVKIGGIKLVDSDKDITELNTKLEDINKSIEELKAQSAVDELKLNKLLNEQKNVQGEIDKLLKDTELIHVQLILLN